MSCACVLLACLTYPPAWCMVLLLSLHLPSGCHCSQRRHFQLCPCIISYLLQRLLVCVQCRTDSNPGRCRGVSPNLKPQGVRSWGHCFPHACSESSCSHVIQGREWKYLWTHRWQVCYGHACIRIVRDREVCVCVCVCVCCMCVRVCVCVHAFLRVRDDHSVICVERKFLSNERH